MTALELLMWSCGFAVLFCAGVLCGSKNGFNAGYVRGRQDAAKAIEEAFTNVGRDE